MKRKAFYLLIVFLTVVDGYLLSKPNILGKIGLAIYKFHNLRTFPRSLLTVSMVVGVAVIIAELVRFLALKQVVSVNAGRVLLIVLILVCGAILIKTGLDFSTWATGHTGRRFKYGAYLLPTLLIIIFGYGLTNLPKGLDSGGPRATKNN